MNVSIRHFELSDAWDLFALIAFNREQLSTFTWAGNASIESTVDFILNQAILNDKRDIYAIIADNRIVGVIELRDIACGLQLGYWLDGSSTGKGIMSTAVSKVIACHSETIYAKTWIGNDKSQQVLQRCGFKQYDADHKWIYFSKAPV
jgi:RimJ/RimL family protein N-acetyltransferase